MGVFIRGQIMSSSARLVEAGMLFRHYSALAHHTTPPPSKCLESCLVLQLPPPPLCIKFSLLYLTMGVVSSFHHEILRAHMRVQSPHKTSLCHIIPFAFQSCLPLPVPSQVHKLI
jgi:hypothetical protein